MALIVETGAIIANADSYLSVADADAYHAAYGNADWTDLDAVDKEIFLRRATAYMGQVYRSSWKGTRMTLEQPLDWPRYDVLLPDYGANAYVPQNTVPTEVRRACAELAFKASKGDLLADLERGVVEETVGPLTVKYDPYSPQQPRYQTIDLMLSPFLASAGAMRKLVRA